MLRETLVNILADFAGPVGPLRSAVAQIDARDAALQELTADDVELLLELAHDRWVPPTLSTDSWLEAIQDTLITAARQRPAEWVPRIAAYVGTHGTGLLALEVLGGVAHPDALPALRPLIDQAEGLSEEAQAALVAAIGALGDAAQEELARLDDQLADASPAVRQELEEVHTYGLPTPTRREVFEMLDRQEPPGDVEALVREALMGTRRLGDEENG